MKKGPVELGANEEEGDSESKVTNQIFGHLQHTKNEGRYLDNIFSDFRSLFSFMSLRKTKFYRYLNQHILTSWQNLWNHKIIDSVTECYWMYPMHPWSNKGWKVKTCTNWYVTWKRGLNRAGEMKLNGMLWMILEITVWFWTPSSKSVFKQI